MTRRRCRGTSWTRWSLSCDSISAPETGERDRVAGVRATLSIAVLALAILAAGPAAQQRPARTPDIFFAGTRQTIVDGMLRLARVTADDVVYDLGSGDGRIVVVAAQKYRARGVGIELDSRLVSLSRELAAVSEVGDRVTFIEGDMFTTDISPATVVTLYLSESLNLDLEPKLRNELRKGTRIVSHQFRMGRWQPDRDPYSSMARSCSCGSFHEADG